MGSGQTKGEVRENVLIVHQHDRGGAMNMAEKTAHGNGDRKKKVALALAFAVGTVTDVGGTLLFALGVPTHKNICCSGENCWCQSACGNLTDQGNC